eukprot:1982687-Prymnesium_polylepis.1
MSPPAPGPTLVQSCVRPLHVEWSASHGKPVSWQRAPSVFGLTSPRADEANAATKGPAPARAVSLVGPLTCDPRRREGRRQQGCGLRAVGCGVPAGG